MKAVQLVGIVFLNYNIQGYIQYHTTIGREEGKE